MPKPPNILIPGSKSIPSGYVAGRTAPGRGDQQLIDIATLGQQLTASGYVPSNGGSTGLPVIADQRFLANLSGGSAAPIATPFTSITTVGTIGTGTWAGTTIAVNHGGTGQTSYTDGQLLIGNSSGNTLTKASLSAGAGITITPGGGTITISSTSGTGLFAQVLSATPTIASTGLNTWLAQGGASVADVATGMSLTSPSNGGTSTTQLRGRYKTAPGTPYTITVLLALNAIDVDFVWGGFGWYDGSNKLHVLEYYRSVSNPWSIDVRQWSNTTTAGSIETGSTISVLPPCMLVWFRINDDGTNVNFLWSVDGSNFISLYTVAKTSGYLGGSGYTNVILFANAQTTAAPVVATLLSWTQA